MKTQLQLSREYRNGFDLGTQHKDDETPQGLLSRDRLRKALMPYASARFADFWRGYLDGAKSVCRWVE